MSTHAFKGNIQTGEVTATFSSDFSNSGTILLIARYADSTGGGAQAPHAEVAPGGTQTVTVVAAAPGLLEVLVVAGAETDSGRLQTASNGTERNNEATMGSVRWVYTVV